MSRSVEFLSRLALAVAAVVVIAVSARADIVVLKNGARFEGRIVSETEQQIVLATRSGEVVLKRMEIAEVVPGPFGEPAERGKDEKAKAPGARPAPATGKKPLPKAAKPKPPASAAKGAKTPPKKPSTPTATPKAKPPGSAAKKPPLPKPTPPKSTSPVPPRPAPPVRPAGPEKSPALPSGVSFETPGSNG